MLKELVTVGCFLAFAVVDAAEQDTAEVAKRPYYAWPAKHRKGDTASWVSKKMDPEIINHNMDDKRAKFYSWSGKRALSSEDGEPADTRPLEEEKRAKFYSWSGKRGSIDPQEVDGIPGFNNDGSDEGKRAKFYSWSGKRGNADPQEVDGMPGLDNNVPEEEKRAKFYSWSGRKRFDPGPWMKGRDGRAKFYSWSGKRSAAPEKREKFYAWSGKRSSTDYQPQEKKQKFYSWSG